MKYRNDLKRRVLAGLFAGAALCLAAPAALAANSPVANNQLPAGGHVVAGDATVPDILKPGGNPNGATSATITQNSQNAVIVWDNGFNVGANATVNFEGPQSGYNTLNYDKGGSMSQIYGTINANNNGNIYIVNPSGVEIGNSAQINVGSLYVSNKYLDENKFNEFNGSNLSNLYDASQTSDAVLMSLGNVNANSVTFDGNRIVIDTERLKDVNGDKKLNAGNIIVRTNAASNVVIGYDAYDDKDTDKDGVVDGYKNAKPNTGLASVYVGNSDTPTEVTGYMWVEDVEQLQAINTNLSGNYALRNSIDATATQDWNGTFNPLGGTGQNGDDNPFTGKFDGLDYNIFNLNINRGTEEHVGLFGVVGDKAVINNVTLVGGSITGDNYVGALAGLVQGDASISNITNSAKVSGDTSVGGVIGQSDGGEYTNLVNTGTVTGNTNNIGGLIGNMENSTLGGTSYNLGAVTAKDAHNVGGLVGHALNATLGDGKNLIYNRLNVTGAYNVGGIVGNMESTQVYNAENSGNVSATRYKTGDYFYHSAHYKESNEKDIVKQENVNIANAGGIAGSASGSSRITDVLNTGDVSSGTDTEKDYTYCTAGNVGGIVGSAVDTDITDATNRENEVRGAHNVGGIAGYFSREGTLEKGVNDGGDILATGARNDSGFVKEWVRGESTGGEEAIIGNMGGIVGYMDGDDVYIMASANRGTVHSQDITEDTVLPVSQAANVGGIVGKIDRDETKNIDAIKGDVTQAAVSNSYSTGDVRGYMGVGGIAGMMYNGEIAGSYNLGTVNTTRNRASFGPGHYYSVNMGGIVGDTTEGTSASALLYDVYNKGQIGDETFTYYARHVGGIVGRLSGTVEKAYNTGAIYNGYNVVGGIVGWMYKGSINNAFNTGNITVNNQENNSTAGIQAGGIAGGATAGTVTISNVYNLGTIRGFQYNGGATDNNYAVGGIVGGFIGGNTGSSISNAYTTGNLYLNVKGTSSTSGLGSIYGISANYHPHITLTNTYYIRPDKNLENVFTDLSDSAINQDNSNQAINFDDKDDISQYKTKTGDSLFSGITEQNKVNEADAWRIYDGSTPILNAFLPNAKDYFDKPDTDKSGIDSIQYGTAYDPLLTIIKANGKKDNLDFNWQDLKINNDAGLAVYGAGLTLKDFMSTGGSGYFGGLIYSDGALTIKADTDGENPHSITGDVALGSASQLYGSSVAIDADGQVTIYGSVTATGNGTTEQNDPEKDNSGSISITGGNVDIYGQLTSAKKDGDVFVPGINGIAADWKPGDVNDPKVAMSDIGDRFGYTTIKSKVTGNISITANDAEDGHVNVYYGNKGEGIVITGGDLTATASGDVYMDSDLSIGGNLTLKAGQIKDSEGNPVTAVDSEAVLDISNIGKVQAANDAPESKKTSVDYLHEFMHHFAKNAQDGGIISFTGGESKIAVDMWDEEINEGKGGFNLDKFDREGDKFVDDLNNLKFTVNGDTEANTQKYTYIWVSTGEQIKGIQQYKNTHSGSNILTYNFALKNDIDASDVTDYEAIGTNSQNGYTGTFDGRDNRIIGLDTTKTSNGSSQTLTNAGIFDTIGADGTVEDLRVYSGTFSGTANAGAVAGVNNGSISNVTAFGNVVQSEGYAGGITGENTGTIDNASAIGTATAANAEDESRTPATAGGIAGINRNGAEIKNSTSNSAVNASKGNAAALGGVVGVNAGELNNVDSLGVTTGVYKGNTTQYSDNVGGIAGINQAGGTVESAYNESIVSGRENVGGVLGTNLAQTGSDKKSPVSNVANAADVTGESAGNDSEHVGGLVGDNEGSITNGRNNGKITGNNYVGGLVGANGAGSTLTNLVNDSAAAITGDKWVGGIAGSNAGKITASSVDEDGHVIEGNDNLINRGTITGQQYVGGVAGVNTGTIANTNNDVKLYVKDPNATGDEAPRYFGGVAGMNGYVDKTDENKNKTGIIENAKNEATIIAKKADFVGGIVGWNTAAGVLQGMGNSNEGLVEGNSHVGGVAGLNDAAITGKVNSMVGIENSGVVIAHNGGAGGIFGENNGNIEYVEMTNKGIVSGSDSKDENGTDGTGGIFGVNKGNVIHSSLKNEIGGQVMGTQNVGGLIGVNSGDITGGRDENDGSYKYQIYNNGTIQTGTWNDDDKDGIVDEGELTAAAGDSENIAGLFGTNSGKVTAGYNTGAVIAENSTHVGGIAGTNSGTLDQVFNTVITGVNEDGANAYGSITGNSNVGGLVGSNTADGKISNAYNTTGVEGSNTTGSLVGANDGTVSNVYGSGADKLIGSGTGNTSNMYDLAGEGDWDKADSYTGFDFNDTWKIYEGSTNPLLKVFLTKVTISGDTDLGLVYNGKDQDIDLDDFTSHSGISAADDFAAYENNNSLIQNTDFEHKNAGSYSDWLYSGQIAAGTGEDGFNPNNLGYDIDFTQDIDKAQITISLDEIHRNYGSSVIKNGGDYGFTVGNADKDAGLTEEMQEELAGITMNRDSVQDGAVSDLADGKTATNNAGTYEWSAEFSLGENTGKDSLANNYELVPAKGTAGSEVTVSENKSIVDKVQLTIDLNDVNRVYGDTAITKNGSYGIENVTGLVNGDEAQKDSLTLADNADIKDGALSEDKTKTNDVKDGGYSWNVSGEDDAGKAQNFTGIDNLATNYDIIIRDGSSMVEQKEISVGDLGASIVYGNQEGKGLVIHGDLGLTGIVYNDDVSLSGDASYTTGGSYDTNKDGRGTADVGTYEDSLFVDGLTLSGEKAGNYKLVTNEAVGDIKVRKANLTITVDNAETTYGTAFDSSKYGYTLGGIVNGDTEDALKGDIGNVTYTNSAAKDGANDVWTDNAGTYDDAVGIDRDTLGELSNYEITTVTNGDAVVNRREISIGAGSHDIYVGENEPTYTGTDIQGQLVNGDMISDDAYQYGPETSVDTNVTGEHTIGIHFGDSHLNTSEQSAWDAVMNGLFQNYTVTFTPGKLTISNMPVDMPSEDEHWNFLFHDNPWDRNRDFRERKAEVHFVAGGMTL